MSLELLNKTRKLIDELQCETSEAVVLNRITNEIMLLLNTNVILLATDGRVLASDFLTDSEQIILFDKIKEVDYISGQLCQQLMNVTKTQENMSMSHLPIKNVAKEKLSSITTAIIPLKASNERLGVMLLFRSTGNYDIDEIVLSENGAMLASFKIISVRSEEIADRQRKLLTVKSAISTLSYSELEAVLYIFEELNSKEGLLVASKIADRVGITRSIIVNAIRKFESAGIIEARSLGMKGTYIKILNDALVVELDKLRGSK